jgi:hypothetical protein
MVFCDLPRVPAGPVGKFLVTQMAAVAEPSLHRASPRPPQNTPAPPRGTTPKGRR